MIKIRVDNPPRAVDEEVDKMLCTCKEIIAYLDYAEFEDKRVFQWFDEIICRYVHIYALIHSIPIEDLPNED